MRGKEEDGLRGGSTSHEAKFSVMRNREHMRGGKGKSREASG